MIESIFFHPWVWIVPLILLILLIGTFVLIWVDREYDWDGIGVFVGCFVGLFALVLAGIYFAWMLVPYDTSFYQTYRVTGEISEYAAAFDETEGVMNRGYVLEVEGVDYQIYSSDQRLRTYAEGDSVTLVCGKIFNYFQEPYLDCAIGGK